MGDDHRFRSVNDYAVRHGFLGGFPNFHQADDGHGVVYGTFLIAHGSGEWRDVPRQTYGVYQIEQVPAMFRAAAGYASSQGFRAGLPTFHQADHGGGVVYGTILLGASVDLRDVPRTRIGIYSIEDVPAMMRAANDYAVSEGYAGGFPTFHQADKGGTTGVVYGVVLLKPSSFTHRDLRADVLALYPRPPDGALLKEESKAPVYLIRDGERLHLPTPYTLEALGRNWGEVKTVPDGELEHIPRDDSWTGIGSPGSTVFVPLWYGGFLGINSGQVYWPLNLPTTKRHVAWGREVRTIELRGWLKKVDAGCYAKDPDWGYDLLLDSEWVLSRGIDLNSIVKLGNILPLGDAYPEGGVTDFKAWCAAPPIHLELVGHPPKDQRERKLPPDWNVEIPGCNLDDPTSREHNGKAVRWPFSPTAPPPRSVELKEGQYVKVFGSLVTDKPHRYDNADLTKATELWWTGGTGNAESNQARWTEIHPPDWIEVVPEGHPDHRGPVDTKEVFRGVAVAAPGSVTGFPRNFSTLDVVIKAPWKEPADPRVLAVQEFVGPETDFATIREGNPARTGAALTLVPDGLRVRVTVAGTKSLFGGGPGKFKALYRLFWVKPGSSQAGLAAVSPVGHPMGEGPHRVTCVSKSSRNRFASVQSIGGDNDDGSAWRLTKREVIASIDSGTGFYVAGWSQASRVRLVTARGLFGRYVKTEADRFRANNLLSLPEC